MPKASDSLTPTYFPATYIGLGSSPRLRCWSGTAD